MSFFFNVQEIFGVFPTAGAKFLIELLSFVVILFSVFWKIVYSSQFLRSHVTAYVLSFCYITTLDRNFFFVLCISDQTVTWCLAADVITNISISGHVFERVKNVNFSKFWLFLAKSLILPSLVSICIHIYSFITSYCQYFLFLQSKTRSTMNCVFNSNHWLGRVGPSRHSFTTEVLQQKFYKIETLQCKSLITADIVICLLFPKRMI